MALREREQTTWPHSRLIGQVTVRRQLPRTRGVGFLLREALSIPRSTMLPRFGRSDLGSNLRQPGCKKHSQQPAKPRLNRRGVNLNGTSLTVNVTSMLLRVALEYGQVSCALPTRTGSLAEPLQPRQ